MKQTLKLLLLISITALMTACKLAVIVVEGGEVQSVGSGTCLEGSICIHQVDDTSYTATFTAVPNSVWVFEKWNSGDGFFCGGSTDPICVVSGEGAEGNAAIETIVASDKTFYIMPIFVRAQPVTDTITVDGKEWAQVDLFTELSWNDINTVCPEGVCAGVLNGYDVTGWKWASINDVNALFNYYIGSDSLGPGRDEYGESAGSAWSAAFWLDEWQPTYQTDPCLGVGCRPLSSSIFGWMRNLSNSGEVFQGVLADNVDYSYVVMDVAATKGRSPPEKDEPHVGAWFYRVP